MVDNGFRTKQPLGIRLAKLLRLECRNLWTLASGLSTPWEQGWSSYCDWSAQLADTGFRNK